MSPLYQERSAESINSTRPTTRRSLFAGLFGLLVLLAAGACGGGDEPSVGDVLDAANNFDTNDDGISGNFDDAAVQFGSDTGRPDWLQDWVELPAGSEIGMAIDDPSTGDRAIEALVRDTSAEAVEAHLFSLLLNQGYERLGETGYFVKSGEPIIDVNVSGDGAGLVRYSWEHDLQDEQVLRDAYAPSESEGVLTLTAGGTSADFAGTCTLRSTSGYFSIDDGGDLEVQLRDGEDDYVYGNVTIAEGDTVAIWSFDFSEAPVGTLTGSGFVVEGMLRNTMASSEPSVAGNMTVNCG